MKDKLDWSHLQYRKTIKSGRLTRVKYFIRFFVIHRAEFYLSRYWQHWEYCIGNIADENNGFSANLEMADNQQSRFEKSLGLLTTRFVTLLQKAKDGVLDLKVVSMLCGKRWTYFCIVELCMF